jgi:predicted Fe-Mo cluster-binding NifX family protein
MLNTKTISIPVLCAEGMDSPVSPHYARSPLHAVVKIDDGSISFLPSGKGDSGKKRIPFEGMKNASVETVICLQIGRHAFELLKAEGIGVLVTKATTIRDVVNEMNSGKLIAPTNAMLDHEGVMKKCHEEGDECQREEGAGRCCENGGQRREGCHHRHGEGRGCCHHGE